MATRNELKKLARKRLEEAKALFNNGHFDGACYLAGYVIELGLKARICKLLDVNQYIDSGELSKSFKTHKLDDLLILAGLDKKFQAAKAANITLFANWSIVTKWNESFRYLPIGTNNKVRTKEVIEALEDSTSGVFTWITKHW